MTTSVKCEHRFTRVIETGNEYCPACNREIGRDGKALPEEPERSARIDGRELLAVAGRSKSGQRRLLIVSDDIPGSWEPTPLTITGKAEWEPGEIATLRLEENGWRAAFGEFEISHADDLGLVRDVLAAARFLDGKGQGQPLTFADGELSDTVDALGLRLPRSMYRGGQFVSHSVYASLAEYLAAKSRPKSPGPLNLRRR